MSNAASASIEQRPVTSSWRTVDILVAAVLGVAFGVVQVVWNNALYAPVNALFGAFPQFGSVYGGVWLIAGVVGGLVVRKPGAALFTEMVAVLVAAFAGSTWGLSVLWYGLIEGGAPELIFLATRYRRFGLPTAALAGAAAGLAMAVLDTLFYFSVWSLGDKLIYAVVAILAASVTAGVLAWLIVRALARTGVLAPLASGRDAAEV